MIVTPTGRIYSRNGMGASGFTPLVYSPVPLPALPTLDSVTGAPIGQSYNAAGTTTLQIIKIQAGNRAAQDAVNKYNTEMTNFIANGGSSNHYGLTAPVLPDVAGIYAAAAAGAKTGSFTGAPVTVPSGGIVTGGTVSAPHPVSVNQTQGNVGSTNAQQQSSGATVGGATSTTATANGESGEMDSTSGIGILALAGIGILAFMFFSKGR